MERRSPNAYIRAYHIFPEISLDVSGIVKPIEPNDCSLFRRIGRTWDAWRIQWTGKCQ